MLQASKGAHLFRQEEKSCLAPALSQFSRFSEMSSRCRAESKPSKLTTSIRFRASCSERRAAPKRRPSSLLSRFSCSLTSTTCAPSILTWRRRFRERSRSWSCAPRRSATYSQHGQKTLATSMRLADTKRLLTGQSSTRIATRKHLQGASNRLALKRRMPVRERSSEFEAPRCYRHPSLSEDLHLQALRHYARAPRAAT